MAYQDPLHLVLAVVEPLGVQLEGLCQTLACSRSLCSDEANDPHPDSTAPRVGRCRRQGGDSAHPRQPLRIAGRSTDRGRSAGAQVVGDGVAELGGLAPQPGGT